MTAKLTAPLRDTPARTAPLTAPLRQAPTTVPALAALVLFVVWATSQAGYPLTHWAPGGVIVLALLAIAAGAVRVRWREIPITVRVAVCCLAAYTALSFLSILWAGVSSEAWEGADRTLLYLLVFALFACWPQRGATAMLLLASWTLALVVLAAYVELHVSAASAASLRALFPGGRLLYPSGYPNANAAQWLMAFWPALLLARSPRLHWALRGLLAGGAVLLGAVALLSQSRGSLYATPVMVVLVFALLPGRARTFALLVPVGLGVGAAAPAVLHVGDSLNAAGNVVSAHVHTAVAVSFAAAVVVGALVALAAAIEGGARLSDGARASVARGTRIATIAAVVVVVVGGLAVAGNPVTRVEHAWHSFKGGYGEDKQSGSRLISGLGSNRYDFYRVALDEFLAHPLVGIGADNFQQQYLAHGRSEETPRYPHSVELRTLAETGLIGALLALVGLAAALLAGARALRASDDPLARCVAAAALAGFAYWLVHGSFDWFWEFAGLGAPAFALLGLACSLSARSAPEPVGHASAGTSAAGPPAVGPRAGAPPAVGPPAVGPPAVGPRAASRRTPGRRTWPARALALATVPLALAAVASLVAPWLSQLEVQSAARIWTKAPASAYSRLREAARLDPLSDEAYVVAGNIALRYGELARADRQFALALERTPGDAYATLARGAIASQRGERPRALRLLERAQQLDPREEIVREALRLVREGQAIDTQELTRLIVAKAQQLS
jgi:O-antigen ligase